MEDNFDTHKWFKNQYLEETNIKEEWTPPDRMGIFDDIDKDIEWEDDKNKVEYLNDVIKYCQNQIDVITTNTPQ